MSATVRNLKTISLEATLGDDINLSISCDAFSDPSQESYFLRLVSASRGGQEGAFFRHDIGEISAIYNRVMRGAVEDKTVVYCRQCTVQSGSRDLVFPIWILCTITCVMTTSTAIVTLSIRGGNIIVTRPGTSVPFN